MENERFQNKIQFWATNYWSLICSFTAYFIISAAYYLHFWVVSPKMMYYQLPGNCIWVFNWVKNM